MSWEIEEKHYSQRRACALIGMPGKTCRDASKRANEDAVRERLRALVELDSWRAVAKQLSRESPNRQLRRQRGWIKTGLQSEDVPFKEPQYHSAWLEKAETKTLRRRWPERMAGWGMVRMPRRAAEATSV